MKVYKITVGYGSPLILNSLEKLEDILGGIEYAEVGDKLFITIEDMSKEEFENLPEWGGF